MPGAGDDKYSRGTVLLATGSPTYPGAAVLGVLGAAHFGAGVVRYLGPERNEGLVLAACPEAVISGGRFDGAVIGSGWDSSMATVADSIARQCAKDHLPLVVDAGALHGVGEWVRAGAFVVATPHAGEAVGMLERLAIPATRQDVEADPQEFAVQIARETGAVVVLKAATTAVATPDGQTFVFEPPSSWGATAGAGDVLAGAIGAALGGAANDVTQGMAQETARLVAVQDAVTVHGLASSIAAGVLDQSLELTGKPGQPITATQIAQHIPDAIGALLSLDRPGSVGPGN